MRPEPPQSTWLHSVITKREFLIKDLILKMFNTGQIEMIANI